MKFDPLENEILESFQKYFYNYIEEKAKIINLSNVSVRDISSDMEQIERTNYTWHFSQDQADLEDDFRQPGFFGMGLFDDRTDKIKGYIYGYALSEDEYEDMENLDLSQMNILNPSYKDITMEDIRRIFTPENTIYVSNLVVERDFRFHVTYLLKEFVENLRGRAKYLVFDALENTTGKILFNSDLTPKTKRLGSVGLEMLGFTNTDYSKLAILELI